MNIPVTSESLFFMPAERVSACFNAWFTLVLFIFQGLRVG